MLQELSLGRTTLTVAIDAFGGLQKLRTLTLANASLTGAKLVSDGKSLFGALGALQTLSLAGNAIEQLKDATVFTDLKNLKSLALDAQRTADKLGLTAIDAKVFTPLAALTKLSLAGNAGFGAKQVAGDTQGALLSPLKKLSSLTLDGCGISNIPPAYFSGVASSLTALSLADNAIPVAMLTDGALAALTNLTTLRLSNSSLKFVPQKAFAQWKQLQEVDLRGNPFHCDTNLNELHVWLQAVTQNFTLPDVQTSYYIPSASQMLVLGYHSYACVSPPTCANVKLADAAFATNLAQCTSTTNSTSTRASPGPPEGSLQSKVWLVVLLTCLCLVLAAAGGYAGWWFWRRRRSGYYPINAPINA